MLTYLLLALILLATALLVYASTRPDVFRIERSTSIKAPPEKLFAMINDYRNWPSWSPYEKLDPAMQRKISGPESGKGSVYEWEGNSKVGKGRMEVLETTPPSNVTIKLDFFKPFEAHNTAVFTLKPNGGATDVTWAMHGPAPFMNKLMGVFMNFDKMVGGQFAEGLANMKAAAEK